MKHAVYPRLAWDGIRKNRRFYLPYILSGAGMVMLFYIIHYLAAMPELRAMPGGRTTEQMLGIGVWIVALFALIFLVYANSFLMRRRKKEFGLYSILGMSKWNLSAVIFWESVFHFAISMACGLLGGILLAKLAELGLTLVLGGEVSYRFTVNRDAFLDTFLFFVPIFGFIFLKSLLSVWRSNAITLVRSENAGEKPPRANYLLGIAGILLLLAAYHIALSIENPLLAVAWFFVAVGMVIVATYLIFISGSVMLCRILQRNKRYYYRKNHFVSVSSMLYRMKRNGAGLASICILSTMVLVMMLGSGSLFLGTEDLLNSRYPSDFNITFIFNNGDGMEYTPDASDAAISLVRDILTKHGYTPEHESHDSTVSGTALLADGRMTFDPDKVNAANMDSMENVTDVYFVSLSEYRACFGETEDLAENEVLLYCNRRDYSGDTITLEDGTVFYIKNRVSQMFGNGDAVATMLPYVYLVVNDLNEAARTLNRLFPDGFETAVYTRYRFDLELSTDDAMALNAEINEVIRAQDSLRSYSFSECRAEEQEETRGITAGIFFLGVFLSLVFLMATVLIIYYKQVTEGYEDESRYEIMQKVGMTREDIRKSINSQILTVFFLPLVTAILHTCFAFPMVQKLLLLFNLSNVSLMWMVFAATAVVFGIFYALVYKATSNAYFAIVSNPTKA